VDYMADDSQTAEFLLGQRGSVRPAVRAAARDVADYARSIAPIDEGYYILSIKVTDGDGSDRFEARVSADDAAAAPLEFGNDNTAGTGRHLLARAAELAGLDVDVSS
jgi:hypothetical protein